MTARESIQQEWERFKQQCYEGNTILPQMNEVERAFHGGIMVGLSLNVDHKTNELVTAIDEWAKTSVATANFRQDKRAEWTPIATPPPAGQLVETMIDDPHSGVWCLIKRRYDGPGKWIDEGAGSFPPPTHWHAL